MRWLFVSLKGQGQGGVREPLTCIHAGFSQVSPHVCCHPKPSAPSSVHQLLLAYLVQWQVCRIHIGLSILIIESGCSSFMYLWMTPKSHGTGGSKVEVNKHSIHLDYIVKTQALTNWTCGCLSKTIIEGWYWLLCATVVNKKSQNSCTEYEKHIEKHWLHLSQSRCCLHTNEQWTKLRV